MNASLNTTKGAKASPIPTRFEQLDMDFLDEVVRTTGLSRSEIIRRSVRLARNACAAEPQNRYAVLFTTAA